jgi:hypothetical protein
MALGRRNKQQRLVQLRNIAADFSAIGHLTRNFAAVMCWKPGLRVA